MLDNTVLPVLSMLSYGGGGRSDGLIQRAVGHPAPIITRCCWDRWEQRLDVVTTHSWLELKPQQW